jgi:hypothetical protein
MRGDNLFHNTWERCRCFWLFGWHDWELQRHNLT